MPRRSTGSLFHNAADRLYVRVLVGGNDRESFPLDPKLTEQQAEPRKELVADPAARLRASRNVTRDAIVALLERAAVREGRALRDPLPSPRDEPVPRGFLPKLGPTKAKACLYPDEDARLRARGRAAPRPPPARRHRPPGAFRGSDEPQQVRAHDTRSTFITVALANGRSEIWVADRTGHRSSIMVQRYRRAARTFAELGLGELASLAEALPELGGKASGIASDRGWCGADRGHKS
ncbi:hypothetical protein BE17_14580 [Sorangium cellulosum]|uniref:Uncharacterized protein n=1 Tax=Sorangium cellulosum TaxID=56 RepID=A0A150SB29_SORCE|nr:hypothetical protein BE17_14580 [Sorangium cellulosum]